MKIPPSNRERARLAPILAAGLLAASTANAALNIRYSFEGLVDPAANPNVTNSAPGATVHGTIINPDKASVISGAIVSVGGSSYTLGTSLSLTSIDTEEVTGGHIDTNFLPPDLGVTNGTVWDRDYTMMAWVNFGSTTGDNMVFGQSTGEVLHHGSRNGMLHTAHWGDDIGPDQGVNISSLPNTWHHLTYINQGQAQTIYQDGVLVVGPGATGANAINGGTNILVGTSRNNGSFIGFLDEVKIFGDQVLTEAQIMTEMTAGLTPYTLAVFTSAVLTGTTYTFKLTDSATSLVDLAKAKTLTIDGANVTASASFSKAGAVTTVTYTPAAPPDPGSLHPFTVTVTDNGNKPITGSGSARAPFVSNIVGGGQWDTEQVWTRGSPTMTLASAEEALNDPTVFPPEDTIKVKTAYIHFHDDVGPPLYFADSKPYPLWDPVNGGSGFGNREDFAIRCRGQTKIVKTGTCWFICNSDDGFSLRIDGTEIGSAGDRARGNSVMSADLTAGVHEVELVHWERGGGAGLSVYVFKGISDTAPPVGEDAYELLQALLDPTDTDGDGIPNVYELANELNPAVNDAALDKDGDTLTNLVEFQRGTRANKADTDDDGLNDNRETNTGTFVSAANTGTNPVVADTDGDGLKDGPETNTGTFVSAANAGSNPFVRDTDADGVTDGGEVIIGTNPVVAGPRGTIIEGGGKFTTEHVWTRGTPTLTGAGAEAVLDDPSVFPPEDSITTQTTYIHFHDNVAPPWFVAQSTPYPLWDPANGGPGFADREDYAIRSRGTIKLTKAGMVWFVCNSDDGFFLRVDGTQIGTAPDRGRADTIMSADLSVGLHQVELVHWERAGGAGLSVLIFRATSPTQPTAVNSDTWQLLEAFPTQPASTLAITSFSYAPATSIVNLTFTSAAGSNYALEYTTAFLPAGAPASPTKWTVVPSHSSIAGAAGTTSIAPLNTNSLGLPSNTQLYLRIRKL